MPEVQAYAATDPRRTTPSPLPGLISQGFARNEGVTLSENPNPIAAQKLFLLLLSGPSEFIRKLHPTASPS